MNDDCQTPLDVARVKGSGNVVRAIEVLGDDSSEFTFFLVYKIIVISSILH